MVNDKIFIDKLRERINYLESQRQDALLNDHDAENIKGQIEGIKWCLDIYVTTSINGLNDNRDDN